MSAGWSTVRRWDREPVEAASQALLGVEDRLLSLDDEVRGSATKQWFGLAAEGARVELTGIREELEDRVTEVTAVRRALAEAADAIHGVQNAVAAVERFAHANGLRISDNGMVSDVEGAGKRYATQHDADVADAERRALVQECVTRIDETVRKAAEIDRDLCRVLRDGVLAGRLAATDAASLTAAQQVGYVFAEDGQYAPPSGGPDGTGTAAQNAGWWAALSDVEREAVIYNHPEWIGNRDGVPAWARDRANRLLLPQLSASVDQQISVLEAQREYRRQQELDKLLTTGQGGNYGDVDDPVLYQDIDAKLRVLREQKAALATVTTLAGKPDHHVLGLDLSHGRPQAIVAVGDVDAAQHVAVFTPGLGSSVAGMTGYDDHMRELQLRASRMAYGESVATVTWIGYQSPQVEPGSLISGNSVALSGAASHGGHDLAEFYRGINASRADDPDLTALGHSYGSTTTGYALQEQNTGVDRAAFFGSPGLGVETVDELNVPSGTASYAEAKWDPVGDLDRFGADPTTMEGMKQLQTGAATAPYGTDYSGTRLNDVTMHASYLNDGSTSQYNLATIVANRPDATIAGANVGVTDQPWWWWGPWNA
ncbi:alpha/beta hydrolase [Spongisporangium articulatum]|uniref:Alpha/beta hydrolase n=1 Tax=Spongisporangium articulatum TaxID=3362603 RepID=A0ABW8AT74_9ACTN